MDYHGDLYLYNVCLGSNKNILLLLLLLLLDGKDFKTTLESVFQK